MKGWSKLEHKLNQFIQSLLKQLDKFLAKLTPQKSKQLVQKQQRQLDKKRQAYALKVKSAAQKVRKTKKRITRRASSSLNKVKSIDVKKIKLSHVLTAISAFILPLFSKVKSWYLTLEPKTIVLAIAGGTVVSLASLNIYVQSKKIADDSSNSDQAELVEKLEKANSLTRRPSYFKKEEKQFRIESVFLPVYFGNINAMKRLEIDFTIQASNKYIPAYFNKNHYLVRDALNTGIKPIAADFPLEEVEGKAVVREKIQKELTKLLRKLEIEGEITEVHIHSIFGG